MSNCGICGQDYARCNCVSQQPYCEQCGGDTPCSEIVDSACVIYHPNNDKPSKLDNLGMPNGASAEEIFEAIDDLIGGNNIPLTVEDTNTVDLTATGPAKHNLRADVKVSADANNQIEVHVDGLYVGNSNQFKVKVDANDAPDFLENQMTGGTDGIISISVVKEGGMLKIVPNISIDCLLAQINICDLIAKCNLCDIINAQGCLPEPAPDLAWRIDTYECSQEDLDIVPQKTISNAHNPAFVFEDGGLVYVVCTTSTGGKIFSFNPATANTMGDVTHLLETRSGQPYGPSGGTYVAGTPYTGVNTAAGTEPTAIIGGYYDKTTRTLFVHTNRSFGMDYYDFVAGQWGKVSVGSTGSVYNTTNSTDNYTHIGISSSDTATFMITGWGSGPTSRGRYVITVDKATRTMISEVDSQSVSFAPTLTGNPFNNSWSAQFTSDNRMFITKGATTFRDVAVFNSALTPIFQIVLTNSNTGFGSGGFYWAGSFLDAANNKFYYNDFFSRKVDVYDTTTYALLKTFDLDNNRSFPSAQVGIALLQDTGDLFFNIQYGDLSEVNNNNGVADALLTDLITYKINRSTLEIEKIYIGEPRNDFFKTTTTNQYIGIQGVGAPPSEIATPSETGSVLFYIPNPSPLFTGMRTVLTLEEYNVDTNVATGSTKPNTIGDPDYIAPALDLTLCPVNYTLDAPSRIIATVKAASYVFEFGLNADVYSNPVLDHIDVVVRNTTSVTTIATTTFTLPNTPNIAAFFRDHTIGTGSAGNNFAIDVIYYNSSNVAIATYNNILTGVILA